MTEGQMTVKGMGWGAWGPEDTHLFVGGMFTGDRRDVGGMDVLRESDITGDQ